MRTLLTITFIFLAANNYSQNQKEIDSISFKMCDHLKGTSKSNDTLRVNDVYEKVLYPFLSKVPPEKVDSIGQTTYFRFQRNCPEFREILNRLNPPKDEVSWTESEPKSNITNKEIRQFKKTNKFSYFEVDGARTQVEIKNGYWNDYFTDGTFSKLNYNWISDEKFELIFIESNNVTRSNFSFKGDQLIYKLLDKKEDYYLLSVNIAGQNNYEIFKLYFK